MSVMPLEYVEAPPRTPPAYGILSAAVVVEDQTRGAAWGFEYDPDFCGPARAGVNVCMAAQQKVVDANRNIVTGEPFVLYSLHSCGVIGITDAQGRATRALQAGEGAGVEEWLGQRLAAEADTQNGAWTAGSNREALAALEHYIHCNYAGVGTIHMQRGTASDLATEGAFTTSGGRLTTILGNVVSAGCYDTGGGNVMYATGTVLIQRGPVITPGDPVFDPETNEMYSLAERLYAGAWECFAAGITVTP